MLYEEKERIEVLGGHCIAFHLLFTHSASPLNFVFGPIFLTPSVTSFMTVANFSPSLALTHVILSLSSWLTCACPKAGVVQNVAQWDERREA